MLCEIFFSIVKMSIFSSVAALVLVMVKYILQKLGCPRRIMFVLWALIAFRLICPIAPETNLSSQNIAKLIVPVANEVVSVSEASHMASYEESVVIRYKIADKQFVHTKKVNTAADRNDFAELAASVLWLFGACALLVYGAAAYFRLKKRLRFAVRLKENIYISDSVHTSFVFGIFCPKIYVPNNALEQNLPNVILHEKTHIKRCDHISKIAGYIILALHWFNPIMWFMFRVFSEDMEYACDESVIRIIGSENKKTYLNSLLQEATNKKQTVFLYSVCFGAGITKRRAKNIIELKRSSKLFSVAAVLACVFLFVAFGTDATKEAAQDRTEINVHNAEVQKEAEPVYAAENGGEAVRTEAEGQTVTGAAVPANEALEEKIDDKKTPEKKAAEEKQKSEVSEIAESVYAEEKNSKAAHKDAEGATVEKIKAEHNADIEGIDLEQIILKSEADLKKLEQTLKEDGIFESNASSADLRKNYVVGKYDFSEELKSTSYNLKCDENGNISMYFDINTDNYVDVAFCDAATKEVIAEYGILANDVNVYSFMGFDTDREYDVILQGQTYGDWKVEGEYIIY